jgi:hypothetical protein
MPLLFTTLSNLSASAASLIPEPARTAFSYFSPPSNVTSLPALPAPSLIKVSEVRVDPVLLWRPGNYYAAVKSLVERVRDNGSVIAGTEWHSATEYAMVMDALSRAFEADPKDERLAAVMSKCVEWSRCTVWRHDVNLYELWNPQTFEPRYDQQSPIDPMVAAMRTRALIRYARTIRDYNHEPIHHLYAPHFPADTPIKQDLERLAQLVPNLSESDRATRLCVRRVLKDGAMLARECNDPGAVDYYLRVMDAVDTTSDELIAENGRTWGKEACDTFGRGLEKALLMITDTGHAKNDADDEALHELLTSDGHGLRSMEVRLLAARLSMKSNVGVQASEATLTAHALLAEYHLATSPYCKSQRDMHTFKAASPFASPALSGHDSAWSSMGEEEEEGEWLGKNKEEERFTGSRSRARWHLDHVVRSMIELNRRRMDRGTVVGTTHANVRMWAAQVRAGLLFFRCKCGRVVM